MSGLYHRTTVAQTTLSRTGQKRTFDEFQVPFNNQQASVDIASANNVFKRPALPVHSLKPLRAGIIRDVGSHTGRTEYSQRRELALTPTPAANALLSLSHPAYRLPPQLVVNLSRLGIHSIYPWQSECLLRSGALQGKCNLVYTAPTGGGKSLVADVIMIKNILESSDKKALLVLPYVALVQEKLRWLRAVVEGLYRESWSDDKMQKPQPWLKRGDEHSIRVVGFFGGSKSKATWTDMDIAVCTIEKVHSFALNFIFGWLTSFRQTCL